MSADLYPVRVYFYAHRGIVKAPGIVRNITQPPEIPGMPAIAGIDYAPCTDTYDITPRNEGRREMTRGERNMMKVWLEMVKRGEA